MKYLKILFEAISEMCREMVLVPVDKYKYLIDKIEMFENNSNNQTGGDLQDKAPTTINEPNQPDDFQKQESNTSKTEGDTREKSNVTDSLSVKNDSDQYVEISPNRFLQILIRKPSNRRRKKWLSFKM